MITASHNVASDNGVKLVDPSGEMLDPAWEIYADTLAQASTDGDVAAILTSLAEKHAPHGHAGRVLIGRDTRDSGPRLTAACRAGIEAAGAKAIDIGVVTTPELHFSVQTSNKYGTHEELAYFTTLVESFRTLSLGTPVPAEPLHVDCANGVGALKLQEIMAPLAQLGLHLQLYNTGAGQLNHLCGADYVQKEQSFPSGG
jgi:phosphoacetylglucosamine mutase